MLVIEDLLTVGAHIGNLSRHRHPRFIDYLLGCFQNRDVIDVRHTVKSLPKAKDVIVDVISKGNTVLFVGTKQHVRKPLKAIADKYHIAALCNRYIGGILTNFPVIEKSIKYYLLLEKAVKFGSPGTTKWERLQQEKERKKRAWWYKDLNGMTSVPSVVVIFDPVHEAVALQETLKAKIPVIVIGSSNSDPEKADYYIPINISSNSSVNCIMSEIEEAIVDGKKQQNELKKGKEASSMHR